MSSWWETAKNILKGKPKGSKLIVLGVFLVSLGVALDSIGLDKGLIFAILGSIAFGAGIAVYREEAELELERKKQKK